MGCWDVGLVGLCSLSFVVCCVGLLARLLACLFSVGLFACSFDFVIDRLLVDLIVYWLDRLVGWIVSLFLSLFLLLFAGSFVQLCIHVLFPGCLCCKAVCAFVCMFDCLLA